MKTYSTIFRFRRITLRFLGQKRAIDLHPPRNEEYAELIVDCQDMDLTDLIWVEFFDYGAASIKFPVTKRYGLITGAEGQSITFNFDVHYVNDCFVEPAEGETGMLQVAAPNEIRSLLLYGIFEETIR